MRTVPELIMLAAHLTHLLPWKYGRAHPLPLWKTRVDYQVSRVGELLTGVGEEPCV